MLREHTWAHNVERGILMGTCDGKGHSDGAYDVTEHIWGNIIERGTLSVRGHSDRNTSVRWHCDGAANVREHT
ncbi:unnamed protein product, partial [Staurois parvus]